MTSGDQTSASSSDAEIISIDEFERLAQARLEKVKQAERELRFENIPDQALLWMALPPGWTVPLADQCGFPGAERGKAQELFDRMHANGLVEMLKPPVRPGETVSPSPVYVMNQSSRSEFLETYLRQSGESAFPQFSRKQFSLSKIVQRAVQSSERTQGIDILREVLGEIGQRVSKMSYGQKDVPGQVKRWAELAARSADAESLIGFFDEKVDQAFRKQDAGEILNWIEAARSLAELLALDLVTQMKIALGRAGRRMELLHRRRSDEGHLNAYLRRVEQVEAFNQLMDGPDELWALHYIGAGGVGKTMLIRDITVNLTAGGDPDQYGCADVTGKNPVKARTDIATARIDFDYLNADYPRLAPGLLLWSFAQELRAYDKTGRANRLFDLADRKLNELRQLMSADRYRTGERASQHPFFMDAMSLYIEAIQQLERRVLLVLDTCEELAKVSFDEAPFENVNETFRILRALHEGPRTLLDENAPSSGGIPSLRVIFSGRRPLASHGFGWSCDSSQLPERPFLRLHDIRGFTHEEALTFLQCVRVPEPLIPVVIRASSPDAGSAFDIKWDDPANRPPDLMRCNPYQLQLYTDWAKEVPPPSPEDIANATTVQYVELRIIRRLGDDALEEVLPGAALLGHFDQEMLRATSDLKGTEFEEAYKNLQEQEWIDRRYVNRVDGGEVRTILDVEKGVRDRLLAYYNQKELSLDSVRQRAAKYVQKMILTANLGELNWSDFDAGLRVSENDLDRAAAWWKKVEARILKERDLQWVLDVLGYLQGEDGAAALRDDTAGPETPPENRLRPLVLASYASALLHSGSPGKLAEIWDEISHKSSAYPESQEYRRLKLRALAGGIAAARYNQAAPQPDQVYALWQVLDQDGLSAVEIPQLAASLVAAAEALLEHCEQLAENEPAAARSLLEIPEPPDSRAPARLGPALLADLIAMGVDYWSGRPALQKSSVDDSIGVPRQVSPDEFQDPAWRESAELLLGFAFSLAGRACALCRQDDQAIKYFYRSLEHAPIEDSSLAAIRWADWIAPEDLPARVRLEFIRTAYPALLSSKQVLESLASWQGPPDAVDQDRLHSAILKALLAQGPVPAEMLADLGFFDLKKGAPVFREAGFVSRPEACYAHRVVPPLFAAACEALAANGWVEDALDQLRYVSTQTDQFNIETIRQAERAMLRIIQRMRLNDEGEMAGTSLSDSGDWRDDLLVKTAQAFEGLKLPRKFLPPEKAKVADGMELAREAHMIWRGFSALPTPQVEATLDAWWEARNGLWEPGLAAEDYDFWMVSIALDLVELGYLRNETGAADGNLGPAPVEMLHALMDYNSLIWWRTHEDQPERALILLLRAEALGIIPQSPERAIPEELIERIGKRRAAELAFEEGGLLALRLPALADVLFAHAYNWFESCEDTVGVVISCAARSMGIAGQASNELGLVGRDTPAGVDHRQIIEQLRPVYKRLNNRLGLPPWEQLQELAQTADPNLFDDLHPHAWRPWLLRLVSCLGFQIDVTGARSRSLEIWVKEHYAVTVDGNAEIPAEWASRFTGFISAKGIAGARDVNPMMEAKVVREDRSWIWYLILGIVILLALLLGGFFLTQWVSRPLLDMKSLPISQQVGIYAGVLVALGIIVSLVRRFPKSYRSYLASLSYLALDIEPASKIRGRRMVSQEQPVKMNMTRWRPEISLRKFPPVERYPVELPEMAFQSPGTAPYQSLMSVLDGEILEDLKILRDTLGRRSVEVQINPGNGVHGSCWEAILALNFKEQDDIKPSRLPFRFRRVVSGRKSAVGSTGSYLAISLVAGDIAEQVSRRAWSGSGVQWRLIRPADLQEVQIKEKFAVGSYGSKVQEKPDEGPLADFSSITLLHLIGAVEETTAGLRMRLAADPALQYQVESISERGGAQLLSARQLIRDFPSLKFCVIQGELGELSPRRLESDRRNAGLARAFAAELAALGVSTVLVIPALEAGQAVRILERLVKRISPGVSQRVLLGAIAGAQDLIVDGIQDSAAAWETALDMCLYTLDVNQRESDPGLKHA